MTIKTIRVPGSNRVVRFGRRHPVVRVPHFSFSRYARRLVAPPGSCDYSPLGADSLQDVFLNDAEGNCVIAGGYHVVGVETGNAGSIFIPSDDQLNADYSAIGGYVVGDPSTDNGCDEQTAMNYWTQHGFANGTKLAGWLSVDATNLTQVKQAMYLFENLFFGVDLPDAWISPFPAANGFTWGVKGKSDPENGHCFIGAGYNSSGVKIGTWGMTGTVTWQAVSTYAVANSGGALYVMLSPDQIAKATQRAPNGLDWATLINDFDALGGSVIPITPSPSPQPSPTPTPVVTVVTLQQALDWATRPLAGRGKMMRSELAKREVSSSLTFNWPK